jgi:carboxylate-amine ligase
MGARLTATAETGWAQWRPSAAYTVGIEEEVMLLDPEDWSLAHRVDDVLPRLSPDLAAQVWAETHGAAIELATTPQQTVSEAAAQLAHLRSSLVGELAPLGLRAAVSGTHPSAVWTATRISAGERYQFVYGSMRELARREPTFALHVHVGVPGHEDALALYNSMRGHLPLLLALSVNSPFWQGRDTGLASARTPLFQAFPRVGVPREFANYAEYAETVDLLLRCQAFPDPTFLWWDVRLQPRFGTVELRIMDAQTRVGETAALCALVQSIARLELEEGYHLEHLVPEVLDENRFLAARDGMEAELIDPVRERRVAARALLEDLLEAARPHAAELGCLAELEAVADLAQQPGAARQLEVARLPDRLRGLMAELADEFVE